MHFLYQHLIMSIFFFKPPQVPKKKARTRWEEYAATKGILNKKKSRMVWDEPSQVNMF